MQSCNSEPQTGRSSSVVAGGAEAGGVNFGKFLSSSSATVVVRTAGAGFSFLMNIVVVRTLGAREAGIFFLGQTCLLILAMVSRFGLDNVLVRFISTSSDQQRSGAANGVLLKSFAIAAPLSIAIGSLTYTLAPWCSRRLLNQPDFQQVLQLVALGVVPYTVFCLVSFALQGRKCFVWSMSINAALYPLMLLIVAALPERFGVDSAAALTRLSVGAAVINSILALTVWGYASDRSLDRVHVRWNQIIGTAFPLFCIAIVNYANTWSPQLVLAAFADPDQVAVLAVSQRTAALLALFLLPVSAVASPTFAALYARRELETLRTFARQANGVILSASVPLLATIFVLAPWVLSVFGPQFSEAKWVLRSLIVGQLFTAISGSASFLLMVSGNERIFRNSTVVSAVGGLVLAIALIPTWGALGAAIAGAGSLMIWNSLIWWITYRRLGVNVFRPDFSVTRSLVRRLSSLTNRGKSAA